MKVIFPGSFDPITKGHMDIIERASKVFGEVIVLIMDNPSKEYTFSKEMRLAMIETCIQNLPNVTSDSSTGLTIDYAKKHHIQGLIRGIREVMDYEYEMQQATINMLLDPQIETFFLLSRPEYSFLSSSATKIVAKNKGDITRFVPKCISDVIKSYYQ
ncbi:MAG: pantetheine-phosphate adenylyltransferase [Erysipelotrichaceae bacterium]